MFYLEWSIGILLGGGDVVGGGQGDSSNITADALQGPFAFYKGFFPNFGRLGSWNAIMFLTLEQVRFTNYTFGI